MNFQKLSLPIKFLGGLVFIGLAVSLIGFCFLNLNL